MYSKNYCLLRGLTDEFIVTIPLNTNQADVHIVYNNTILVIVMWTTEIKIFAVQYYFAEDENDTVVSYYKLFKFKLVKKSEKI